jgi:cytochrome c oxidase assembly protein subunit 15
VLNHGRIMLAAASVVLFTGTLVTGAGPNSGDDRAPRLGFRLVDIARVHSATVWIFTVIALALAIRLARHPGTPTRMAQWLLGSVVAQGAVGYIQYALGVPPAIVELHVLGSLVVWSTAVLVYLNLFTRPPLEQPAEGGTLDLTDRNSHDAVIGASVLSRIEV